VEVINTEILEITTNTGGQQIVEISKIFLFLSSAC
jgi:hypothetical protein